jgi:ribonucleoside-diphosphate reductase subunit M2
MESVNDKLYSLLPVSDFDLFELYNKARLTFWTHDEIELDYDISDWNNRLSDNERHFISNILGFFVQSDQIVNINLSERFIKDIEEIPEDLYKYSKLFYNFQQMIEDVHTLTYETLLNTLITDYDTNQFYKNSIKNIPAISKKAKWATKYIEDQVSTFPIRLIAFAILEGIFFSGSFCSIFWLGQKDPSNQNLMRGLVQSNKFINRDENLHYTFACTLFNKLKNHPDYDVEVDEEIVSDMVQEAVDIECEFINSSIPCAMIGMNADLMSMYIKYVADRLLIDIHMKPIYNTKNPFDFMRMLGMIDACNFFEQKETTYQKPVVGNMSGYDSDDNNF